MIHCGKVVKRDVQIYRFHNPGEKLPFNHTLLHLPMKRNIYSILGNFSHTKKLCTPLEKGSSHDLFLQGVASQDSSK